MALRRALAEAVAARDGIALVAGTAIADQAIGPHRAELTLADGRRFAAPLLVGAEGRHSPTRAAAGIAMTHWSYHQQGIVAPIALERAHGGTAYQIFQPEGPLAILPLPDWPDGRPAASIVWTVPEAAAARWLAIGDRAFAAALQARMAGFLGAIELRGPRLAWPLGLHQAARMVAPRVALVGDAAHGIHPLAGQGLNLGLRDVAALVELLDDGMQLGLDPGDHAQLLRYQAWRSLDTLMMAAMTDGLSRLYGVPGGAASTLRRAGMRAVGRLAPLRAAIVDEARGLSGTLPRLLQPLS